MAHTTTTKKVQNEKKTNENESESVSNLRVVWIYFQVIQGEIQTLRRFYFVFSCFVASSS